MGKGNEVLGLGLAVARGEVAEVDRLLAKGANVKQRDGWGRTPLIAAIANHHIHVIVIAERLLLAGADVNAQNNHGKTALMEAILHNDVEAVTLLMRFGANVHLRDRKGNTALTMVSWTPDSAIAQIVKKATVRKR